MTTYSNMSYDEQKELELALINNIETFFEKTGIPFGEALGMLEDRRTRLKGDHGMIFTRMKDMLNAFMDYYGVPMEIMDNWINNYIAEPVM